jgi:hypothetical protein
MGFRHPHSAFARSIGFGPGLSGGSLPSGSSYSKMTWVQHCNWPRAFDQGARDRGDAQGDPRRRGHRGGPAEGRPSDREALRGLRLTGAAELVETAIEETFAYYTFPEEHIRRIRTNNPLERILREIRRRTHVVAAFPDGQSALNLAAARLRHIAGTAWSTKRYLNIELLKDQRMRGAITARASAGRHSTQSNVRKTLDTTGHFECHDRAVGTRGYILVVDNPIDWSKKVVSIHKKGRTFSGKCLIW